MKTWMRWFVLLIFLLAGAVAWAGFCTNCGEKPRQGDKFCAQCGTRLPAEKMIEKTAQPPIARPATLHKKKRVPVAIPATSRGLKPNLFMVTTKYMTVEGKLIFEDHQFFIADIDEEMARVWSTDGVSSHELVMGWISLSELEKRSTFRRAAKVYTVEPSTPRGNHHRH